MFFFVIFQKSEKTCRVRTKPIWCAKRAEKRPPGKCEKMKKNAFFVTFLVTFWVILSIFRLIGIFGVFSEWVFFLVIFSPKNQKIANW